MSKLKLSTREIGNVNVFDLIGEPTQETLQDVAWQIQRKIRRHRMQRVILNLQLLPSIDALGVRKLIAACIRPQKSLIFGASSTISHFLENTYLPRNIHICTTEKEVAEDFGPFLLEKEEERAFPRKDDNPLHQSIGEQLERRRSKRMHVVLPIDIVFTGEKEAIDFQKKYMNSKVPFKIHNRVKNTIYISAAENSREGLRDLLGWLKQNLPKHPSPIELVRSALNGAYFEKPYEPSIPILNR